MAVGQNAGVDFGCSMRPRLGERVGGDLAQVRPLSEGLLLLIVDVLGHGPQAYPLTQQIDAALADPGTTEVARLMRQLHDQLQGTRGAAVGLCAIDSAQGTLCYVGIGNTSMRRFGEGEGESRLVSQDGVLGQNIRTLKTQDMQLQPGDVIVMHTDGISARFTDKDYPGLFTHPAQSVADNIISRFGKDHDDAACIVVRYQP